MLGAAATVERLVNASGPPVSESPHIACSTNVASVA